MVTNATILIAVVKFVRYTDIESLCCTPETNMSIIYQLNKRLIYQLLVGHLHMFKTNHKLSSPCTAHSSHAKASES